MIGYICHMVNWIWIWPGLLGLLAGFGELLSRYRTFERMLNVFSLLYMLINFLAAVLVYELIEIYKINLGSLGEHQIGKILFAGLGAMAFLRSSFFNVKLANDKVIEVGPAAFLAIFLDAAQRQFDQLISGDNITFMGQLMSELNFLSASKDLPILILSSMRVLSQDEQRELSNDILKLVNDTNSTTEVKNIALGTLLYKYTGRKQLRCAVTELKKIYAEKITPGLDKIKELQEQLLKFKSKP